MTLAGVPPHFGIYAAIWAFSSARSSIRREFSMAARTTRCPPPSVTLLPIAAPFGAEYMGYALTLGSWRTDPVFYLVRPLGRMLDLISEPVIDGFICGIGLF